MLRHRVGGRVEVLHCAHHGHHRFCPIQLLRNRVVLRLHPGAHLFADAEELVGAEGLAGGHLEQLPAPQHVPLPS